MFESNFIVKRIILVEWAALTTPLQNTSLRFGFILSFAPPVTDMTKFGDFNCHTSNKSLVTLSRLVLFDNRTYFNNNDQLQIIIFSNLKK